MISLRTETQARTDTGLVRTLNEDRFLAADARGTWAVADGMGGMACGDRAAAAVIETIEAVDAPGDFDALVLAVAEAIRAANRIVLAESRTRGAQMGSTVVALMIRDRRFGVLWTGDSRAYLLRGGTLHQITRDHSQVQELIDAGLLTPEGAATHAARHALTRAIGIVEPVEIDLVDDAVLAGDLFLLCSDGLHGVLDEAEMTAMLRDVASGGSTQPLVARCLERGAPDNVTLVTVLAAEPTLLRIEPMLPAGTP